jgi:HD-like signal output (HDOD) protein
MQSRRMEILKRVEERGVLPSLSPLTLKLIETASEESCSAQDITNLVSQDPSLTTRLLKLSNSAFFRTRSKISTISRAVVLLGINRVRSMALGLSLRDTFPMGVHGNMDYDRFWKVSMYRALIGQDLAAEVEGFNSEEVFVAALILEIGQLMLYLALPEAQQKNYPGECLASPDLMRWENEFVGINHREVGKIILKKWGFPEHLAETQACMEADATKKDAPPLAQICELARLGSEMFFARGDNLHVLHKSAYRLFKIPPKTVNKILINAITHVDETADVLKVEADREKDVITILEKANEALEHLNSQMANQIQEFLTRAEAQCADPTKEEENQIHRAREQAIESALQAVAHEIRNPLLSLGGFVHRLSKTLPEKNNYVNMILSEASRIDRVLHELSDFSRHYQPTFQSVGISTILEEVLKDHAKPIEEKSVVVETHFNPADIPVLLVDEDGMKQVFAQCINNALSAMKNGGRRLVLTVQVHRSRNEVSIGFEDTGKQLDDALRADLADPIISSKTFGAGLGLPMARKIVAWHGGRIEIKEGSLGGNRVEIFLPMSGD